MQATKIVLGFVAALFLMVHLLGCSSEMSLRSDMFYTKKHEPRTVMPWHGSVGGQSNTNMWMADVEGFKRMGVKEVE